MEYRALGASSLNVSAISFGTATFGGTTSFYKPWGETDVAEATRLIDVALDAGVTMIDTADVYSNGVAEEILGKAIAGRRDRLLISTKASFRTGPGPDDIGSSRQHLIAACNASLKRLGTDYIDLWQMHGFDSFTPIEETLRALDELVKAGKVRYVGCSNFSGWHLMKSLALADRHDWPRYVAHQAYYSLVARDYEWELMPLAIDQHVGTVVWSPLSGGQLSGKMGRDQPPPDGSRVATQGMRPGLPRDQFYDVVDVLRSIAVEIDRSVSQVALNWVLQRPTVSTLVIGARNEAQLRDNLQAVEFQLSPEQMNRLDAASERQPVYPYWHQRTIFGERNPPPVPGR
ncbi:MAG TPA: aldo/keto reductase [Gemmatimonadaceae bacterium]|nr:aldo/keto reductase [Gemmatimonadaceae bacterium]